MKTLIITLIVFFLIYKVFGLNIDKLPSGEYILWYSFLNNKRKYVILWRL